MKVSNNKLTLLQFIFLIHGVQLGVGVITLPREAAQIAGTDGWISIILCWILTTIASLIIIQIMKKYPNGTILDLISHYFGKWIGKLVTIIFALYFLLATTGIFVRETLFIQSWILPFSKLYVLVIILAIPSYMVASQNIQILGRYSVFVFFMSAWLAVVYLLPLKYANWLYLLPIIKEGWLPIISSIKYSIFSFLGFEVTFFLYPYLNNKEKASLGVIIANLMSMTVFLVVTVVVYAFYNPDQIMVFSEPTLMMLKVIELQFIERLEIVFFSFYLFIISTTVIPYLFFTVFCTSQLFGRQYHKKLLFLYLILTILYLIFFPPTFQSNLNVQRAIDYFGVSIAYIFPVILWFFVIIKDKISNRSRQG